MSMLIKIFPLKGWFECFVTRYNGYRLVWEISFFSLCTGVELSFSVSLHWKSRGWLLSFSKCLFINYEEYYISVVIGDALNYTNIIFANAELALLSSSETDLDPLLFLVSCWVWSVGPLYVEGLESQSRGIGSTPTICWTLSPAVGLEHRACDRVAGEDAEQYTGGGGTTPGILHQSPEF